MNEFVILSDSCHDLPKALAEKLEIGVAPLSVAYDENTVFDDGTMDPHDFYEGIRAGKMPKTSAVNLEGWARLMEPAMKAGKDVLALCISSALSTTYQSAVIAGDELMEKYPGRKVLVVDTLSAAVGMGLLVWNAAMMRNEGRDIETVRAWVEEHKLNVCHWVTVNDLMHLKRGGRVSATAALLGTMLQIKPVMHMDDEGHLIPVSKARGRKASLQALVQQMAETAVEPEKQTVFICHGACIDDAEYTASLIREKTGAKTIIINYVGPVIGAHTGPGVVSIFFLGTHR